MSSICCRRPGSCLVCIAGAWQSIMFSATESSSSQFHRPGAWSLLCVLVPDGSSRWDRLSSLPLFRSWWWWTTRGHSNSARRFATRSSFLIPCSSAVRSCSWGAADLPPEPPHVVRHSDDHDHVDGVDGTRNAQRSGVRITMDVALPPQEGHWATQDPTFQRHAVNGGTRHR